MNRIELQKTIRKNVEELLEEKNYVSSVDLLIRLNYLSKSDYEKWRFGKIEFLEKACTANLSKLSYINSHLKSVSRELNLKESWTAYMKFGKGPKIKLRFSKSSDKNIEDRYSTHYVRNKK
jgi:hypothetical protein